MNKFNDIDDLPKPYEAGAGCFAWSLIIGFLFGIGLICGVVWFVSAFLNKGEI